MTDEIKDQEDAGEPEAGAPSEGVGQAKAVLTVKKGEEVVREFIVEKLPVKIGRRSDSDIVLEDKNVSRNHAQIVLKDGQYTVKDLGSTGGTRLNKEAVIEKDIHTGDVVEIGHFALHFNSGIPDDERTVFEPEEKTVLEEGTVVDQDRTVFYEEPEAKLVVVKSESPIADVPLKDKEIVIGREEGVGLKIDDTRLSRKHCKIVLEGDRFVITDLGSANGTFVNNVKITQKTLENKDRIQIGSVILEFRREVHAPPKPKAHYRIFGKLFGGLALIAVLGFVGYRVLTTLKSQKPKAVVLQKVWEKPVQAAVLASPSLGDLNGDGFLDVVAADTLGFVYALDGRQGGSIWNVEYATQGGLVTASPLIVALGSATGMDVVIGTTRAGVTALRGTSARALWKSRTAAVISPGLARADVNADAIHDVFVGTREGRVVCLDGKQGGVIWNTDAGAPVETSPVSVDLNNDGVKDVLVASLMPKLFCLDGKNGSPIWAYSAQEPFSTAAVADFNNDDIPDVAVVGPSLLSVLEGTRGTVLWTWTVPASARPTQADPFLPAAPAAVDINADGTPDVVFSTPGGHVFAVDGASKGSRNLWDFALTPSRKTAPAIADLTGDNVVDVVVGDRDGNVTVIDGKTGYQASQLNLGGAIFSAPAIGDLTSSETVGLVLGTADGRIVALATQTPAKKDAVLFNN